MRFLEVRTPFPFLNEAIARSAIRARSMVGRRNYQRFVVVGLARTGSTLLLNLLNSHNQVVAFGELFRGNGTIGWDICPFSTRQSPSLSRSSVERPLEFLETQVFRRWPREVRAVGFKLFYYHARKGPQAAVWDHLRTDRELAVLHIKRLNILEQYLSLQVAHATNVWVASKQSCDTGSPIRLEPEACLRHFEQVRTQEQECDRFFSGCRIATVTYEDLVADRRSVVERVLGQLGVAPEPFEARARVFRQRTQPMSTAIANYDELRSFFAGSEWERFFCQTDTAIAIRAAV